MVDGVAGDLGHPVSVPQAKNPGVGLVIILLQNMEEVSALAQVLQ